MVFSGPCEKGRYPETHSQATTSSPEAGLQTASSSEDISSMHDSPIINGVIGKVEPSAGLLANGFAAAMDTGLKVNGPARACIMSALSIDTKSNQESALKMVSSTMGITLTNGAAVTAVTQ
uniref:Uncharacterized protein n=1 Tax=Anopheles melas TaxID=34690 RepID=A0A182UIY6_9DIPT